MVSLDVGCGVNPKGDVNCDLYVHDAGHRLDGSVIEGVKNFVVCDALFLPFKSKVFTRVTCNQVIEHVRDPLRLLRELQRVCKGILTIQCPHRFGDDRKNSFHVNRFSRRWFINNANVVGSRVYAWRTLPFGFFPFLPTEFEVTIKC